MKFSLLSSLLILLLININSQTTNNTLIFEDLYNEAKKNFENGFHESSATDKAIELCPDISKYPDLLIYKATFLEFNNEKLLATKYGLLALNLAIKKKDRFLALDLLGFIYSSSDDLNKSVSYYEEALLLAKELKLKENIEEIEFNLLLRNFDEAKNKEDAIQKLVNFYLSLPTSKTIEEKLSYLMVIVDLNKESIMPEQFEILKKSIHKNFDKTSLEPYFLGQYYFSYSILESYSKNYNLALKYNDSSYTISKKFLTEESVLNNFYIYKNLYKKVDEPNIALKYADSILDIEEKFKTVEFESGLKIVDENILFNQTKKKAEKEVKSYKTTLLIAVILIVLIFIFYIIHNKKQKKQLQKVDSELKINKGKYNKSLKEKFEFRKKIKMLLKEKKFDEISKLHKTHEINDINNETYIVYLVSDIEKTFLNRLEKHTFTFSDIEKVVLFYRKNNHTYKEIALITGRSLRSIQSLSYRLNKKIQSKTGLELASFLEKI